jgi:hypothetical protein
VKNGSVTAWRQRKLSVNNISSSVYHHQREMFGVMKASETASRASWRSTAQASRMPARRAAWQHQQAARGWQQWRRESRRWAASGVKGW